MRKSGVVKKNLFDVKDKIVIVTGGLGRLGRQFSKALLENGARVAVFDLACTREKVSVRFGSHAESGRLLVLDVDVTKKRTLESGLGIVKETWGVPHALINNAGLDAPPNAPEEENGPFETYPEKSFDRVMEVNAKGVFLCCQVVGAEMAKEGRGSIVNISSIYGILSPDQRIYEYRRGGGTQFYKPVAYSASKSALLNLTRYLSTYWAQRNVRVNTVTLGGVFDNQHEEFLSGYCARTPLGRMAAEDEYNGVIIFLVSDATSYMTGANMVVDGGFSSW